MLGGSRAAQQQERLGAWRHAAGPHRSALGIDQRIFRAVLPDGDGAALLQRDVERVGQPALDGGALHPVDRLELLPRRLQIDTEERIARLDVEGGQDGALLDIVAALDRDIGSA